MREEGEWGLASDLVGPHSIQAAARAGVSGGQSHRSIRPFSRWGLARSALCPSLPLPLPPDQSQSVRFNAQSEPAPKIKRSPTNAQANNGRRPPERPNAQTPLSPFAHAILMHGWASERASERAPRSMKESERILRGQHSAAGSLSIDNRAVGRSVGRSARSMKRCNLPSEQRRHVKHEASQPASHSLGQRDTTISAAAIAAAAAAAAEIMTTA